MTISDLSEANILRLIFTATAWSNIADNAAGTPMTAIACALHTGDPGETGTMITNETNYAGYVRTNVPRATAPTGWTVTQGPGSVSPANSIDFALGTGGTGTVSFFSVGKTGGGATDILWSGTVSPNIGVGSGITPSLTTATTITLD